MKITDNIYLDDNGGIYVEFFAKEGSCQYIHIDCNGSCEFEKELMNAHLNTYWIDYVDIKVIRQHGKLEEWAKNLFQDSDVDFPPPEKETEVEEHIDYCADDIPF